MLGCTKTEASPLSKVTLETDAGVKGSMKYQIDKGAELCLCKYNSIKEGISYNSRKTLNVKGISDSVEKHWGN
jgi:hypothetical protein